MKYFAGERLTGAEIQARNLATALAERGYEISYVCQSLRGKQGLERIGSIDVYWIPYSRNIDLLGTKRALRLLRSIGPDVIYQRYTSFYTAVAAYFAKRQKIPFIWNCTDDSCLTRWSHMRMEWQQLKRTKKFRKVIWLFPAFIEDLAVAYGIRNAAKHIVQNETQRKQLKTRYGLDGILMPSGHEPRLYECSSEKSSRLVLWVGHLGTRKRPEAFVAIANRLRGSEMDFCMIGRTQDPDRRTELYHLLENSNVRHIEEVPFADINDYFRRASLFVNTSMRGREGFPNTFIQAWLAGVPVVSLETDPNSVLARERLGFVCANVESAAETIESLMQNPKILAQYSQRVYEYARQNHDIRDVAVYFTSILEKL
jgi:glycosyltransferase involved in cell wall biosynthesis